MSSPHWKYVHLAIPAFVALAGFLLWRAYGFDALDEWELPSAIWLNNMVGRSDAFDAIIIFLNHFWGEALFVVIIFSAYAVTAARHLPKPTDWRRVGLFGFLIFVTWLVANGIGDQLEPVFSRDSPSRVMGEAHVNLEVIHDTPVKSSSSRSFPSNHGTVFFTVFFMCFHRWGWRVWPIFPLAVLLGLPRVFTGAHWVGDNLIGSLILTWLVTALVMCTPIWIHYQRLEDRLMPVFDRWMGITPPS